MARKQVQATEAERKRDPKEKLAGYLYDISKLTFAALVLGAFSPLINGTEVDYCTVGGGLVATFALAWFANRIMKG